MRITENQRAALTAMAISPKGLGSAYSLKVKTGRRISVSTMFGLSRRGLIRPTRDLGGLAFPQNHNYQITDAGRAALKNI